MSELLRMQMLAGLITEGEYKFKLLNECFIYPQFIDLFDENPKIYQLLNKGILDMDGNILGFDSFKDMADDLNHWGGARGYGGARDWTKPKVTEFLTDIVDDPKIKDELRKELSMTNNVFTDEHIKNMLERTRKYMEKLYPGEGDDWFDSEYGDWCEFKKNR
jgi:hypothetical protein